MDDLIDCDNDLEYLPPDLLLDMTHPATSVYMSNVAMLKRRILEQSCGMSPLHIEVAKLAHKGMKHVKIADRVEVVASTVGNILKRPQTRRLSALMQHLSMAIDGPRESQRKFELWSMFLDNKKDDPRVAISAMAEYNKMCNNRESIDAGLVGGANNKIEIIINNELMPRTVLDA